MNTTSVVTIFLTVFSLGVNQSRAEETKTDVVVYGGTAAAVVAAIQADAMGKSVIVVCPDTHLGGMTSSGLGWTDSKDGNVIGGLAREFYHRIWKHYRNPEAWKFQKRESYTTGAQPRGPAMNDVAEVMWTFEPHVAERVFDEWVREKEIPVYRDEWLDRENGVRLENGRITSITTLSGKTYHARMFIDATYEGDLMAAAGVSYRIGRDTRAKFNESVNGFTMPEKPGDQPGSSRYPGISPYVTPGDPESGLVTGVHNVIEDPIPYGQADRRLQAFNYRLCLTAVPENRVMITKPPGYDEADYELLFRLYESGKTRSGFSLKTFMPNKKTDSNSFGAFGTDYAGGNYSIEEGWTYGDASYEKRSEILRSHENYTRGLIWTIQNHPRIPAESRRKWSRWGLAKDEFTDNGNWPFQLYVREARRMTGETIMTEHHVRQKPGYAINDSIGLGSYHMDCHKVRRIAYEGEIYTEGSLYITGLKPFPISYGVITPKRGEVSNLLVPITVSATHVAFGGIRMEPTYMILGQSAGTAAALSIEQNVAVQDLPYQDLAGRLRNDGQVLSNIGMIQAAMIPGSVIVDDDKAELVGKWAVSTGARPFVGRGYRQDLNEGKGNRSATFKARLKPGKYEVRVAYSPHANRATNVPVTVVHTGGSDTVKINQRNRPKINRFVSIGTYTFGDTGLVKLSNEATDGYVIIDAVAFVLAD